MNCARAYWLLHNLTSIEQEDDDGDGDDDDDDSTRATLGPARIKFVEALAPRVEWRARGRGGAPDDIGGGWWRLRTETERLEVKLMVAARARSWRPGW